MNGRARACLAVERTLGVEFNVCVSDVPSACRIANIALNDAMILSYDANLGRMEFSEGTRRQMSTTERKAEFFALMERFVQLGALLNETFDIEDADALAETKLILAKMNKTQALIDKIMEIEAVS